ncbi:MAG: hypothetical protein U0871_09120 [Gemmataceae bacterium]
MPARSVVVAVLACLTFLLVQFRPVRDVDMFWQVATGERMLATGQLVTADPFSATHAGDPNPPIYWLSQLLYAGILRAGSWELLHKLDAVLFALSLWVAARAMGPVHPIPAALAFAGALLVAMPHHGLRPQTFGMLGFATLVWLNQAELSAVRKAVLAFLVVVLWQNLHPSATVGAGYLALHPFAATIRAVRTGERIPWVRWLVPLAAAVGLVCTPLGFGVFPLSALNADVSRHIGVEEWLPLWHPATWPACQTAWVGLVIGCALMLALRSRVTLEDLTVFAVLSVGMLLVYRVSLFWALATLPIFARWLDAVLPAVWERYADRTASLPVWPVPVASAVTVAVPLLLRPPTFTADMPFAALARAKELGVHGTVYNYREWGGPLLWTVPDARPTIDGRLYLFPMPEWDEYVQAAIGRLPVEQLEAKYQPDAFLLRHSYHADLIRLIRTTGRWEESYSDEHAVLFLPRPTPTSTGAAR